jgi:hypothetical protein
VTRVKAALSVTAASELPETVEIAKMRLAIVGHWSQALPVFEHVASSNAPIAPAV